MGATLVNERVFRAFLGERDKTFYYGHSYCGHPLGASIAREVLAIYRDEHIVDRAAPKAQRIAEAFTRFGELAGVARTRSLGMMGALDLAGGSGYLGEGGWRVYQQALRRGAYLRPLGDTVYIAPPLNIPDPDLDALLAIVEESVRAGVA
jgi:adenosylmethionine-8-amino-7-oxononanoate aminotransferase